MIKGLVRFKQPKELEEGPKNIIYRYFFSGTYSDYIDRKNRVQVPMAWRHILRDKAIITKSSEGCLTLWTSDFFQYFANKKIESCTTEEEKQIVKRLFIGSAITLNIDTKNKMELPLEILDMFDNDHFIYFVGAGDYVEIWTKDMFESWKGTKMPKDMPGEDFQD